MQKNMKDTLQDKKLQSLDTYCIGQTNVLYERYKFNCRTLEEETIDIFIAELRTCPRS